MPPTKYLGQVADPGDWNDFESECASLSLNERLWPDREEREAWYQDFCIEGWPGTSVASPKGSIARAIERNLLRDDVSHRHRLDTVLFDVVTDRVQRASECYRRVLKRTGESHRRPIKFLEGALIDAPHFSQAGTT